VASKPSISAIRRRIGLTQAQLAELLGVHTMTVSKWERGLLAPSAHQKRLLASFQTAGERGVTLAGQRGKKGSLRLLSEVLAQAHATPEIHIGTLSATNRFAGRVVELVRGDVMSKVVIEVAPGVRIGSVITTDSLDRLDLDVGARALAIIKATEVIVGGM
jgi:molybdopterin-binding protein